MTDAIHLQYDDVPHYLDGEDYVAEKRELTTTEKIAVSALFEVGGTLAACALVGATGGAALIIGVGVVVIVVKSRDTIRNSLHEFPGPLGRIHRCLINLANSAFSRACICGWATLAPIQERCNIR